VFDAIKAILMRQDLENSPTDYESGRDFYLSKTTKGGYANYSSSSWSMKERALNVDELSAIEKHGLFTLNSFLPKKPDDAHLAAIMEMFEASVNEDLYDSDRWGQFYRPNGMRMDGFAGNNDVAANTTATPVTKPVTAASIMERAAPKAAPVDEAPFDVDPPKAAAPATPAEKPALNSPDAILAAIRARKLGGQS